MNRLLRRLKIPNRRNELRRHAFIVDGETGLHVIDVSDANKPVQVGIYNQPCIPHAKLRILAQMDEQTKAKGHARLWSPHDDDDPYAKGDRPPESEADSQCQLVLGHAARSPARRGGVAT